MAAHTTTRSRAIGSSFVTPKNPAIKRSDRIAPTIASTLHQPNGTQIPTTASAARKKSPAAVTARKKPESGKPEDTVTWPNGPLSPPLQGQAHLNRPPNSLWASLSRGTRYEAAKCACKTRSAAKSHFNTVIAPCWSHRGTSYGHDASSLCPTRCWLYLASCLESSFSGTRRRDCPTQALCPERELQKDSYCNKRRRMRTSTIMIRATITPLPSWNALRRSYLKLLLFLLRPIVLLSLCSLAVGGILGVRLLLACTMEYGVKRRLCKQACRS